MQMNEGEKSEFDQNKNQDALSLLSNIKTPNKKPKY